MNTLSRARTLGELRERLGGLFGRAAETAAGAEPLKLRPTDVVISPFGKSGTTWLQQIFHQLRTGGDMDFDDISRVVPWIENSPMLGLDLNAEQRANPRGFKSHLPYNRLPRGGKYINSVRHPADAAWSFYKFMEGWFFEPGTVTPDELCTERYIRGDDYFDHLISFWQVKDQDDVLFLCYEGMHGDPRGTIRRVAEFCEIPLTDALLQLVLDRSSIDYMLEYKDRFDDALIRAASERFVPPGGDSAKVRSGRVGEHRGRLSDDFLQQLQAKWEDKIGTELGFATYDALVAAI